VRLSVYKKIVAAMLIFVMTVAVFSFTYPAHAEEELKNNDPERFYIVLDLNSQIVTVYQKNENSEYKDIVRRFLCSSGSNTPKDPEDPEDIGSPTPTGIWKIGGRQRFGNFANFSDFARYWVQIEGDIFFHSVLFSKEDVNTLGSSSYSKLGSAVSHGCVRLQVEDAKWLYYYACPGTSVEVTNQLRTDNATANALKKIKTDFKSYKIAQAGIFETKEPAPDKVWVTYDNAPMRKGNDKSYPATKRLAAGTELEVIIKGAAYYMVRDGKRVGYIARGHVTETKGIVDTVENAKLIKATVWMFSEKNDKKELRICKIPTETCVQVLETDGKWTRVSYYHHEGWIATSSLMTGWGVNWDIAG
jgi:lipoprotein-anchoring transpeptidase ErfK/SrfK/SH3-like domain-containing protein